MWYIISCEGADDVNRVWAHHGPRGSGPGCWARDFDAAYVDRLFGYRDGYAAAAKARQIVATGRGDPQRSGVDIVKRRDLFRRLGVPDWSRGG